MHSKHDFQYKAIISRTFLRIVESVSILMLYTFHDLKIIFPHIVLRYQKPIVKIS